MRQEEDAIDLTRFDQSYQSSDDDIATINKLALCFKRN